LAKRPPSSSSEGEIQLVGIERWLADDLEQPRQVDLRLQAPALAAVARWASGVDERVAQLGGKTSGTGQGPASDEHASSNARSRAVEVHQIAHPLTRAEESFGDHADVGVVARKGGVAGAGFEFLGQGLVAPAEVRRQGHLPVRCPHQPRDGQPHADHVVVFELGP
jgi:hypothetical protein